MSEKDIYEEIGEWSSLLKKHFNEELEPDERKRLSDWLRSDQRNRDLLRRLRDKHLLQDRYHQAQKINVKQELELLTRRYPQLQKRRQLSWWRYAAAVAIFFLLGTSGWFLLHEPDSVKLSKMEIPLKVQAVLKTADGRIIQIMENTKLVGMQGFQMKDSLKGLVQVTDTIKHGVVRYHQLEVPRGGEYKLTLADGTFVQLNSESTIRFPEFFAGHKREIEISGNVYLEVVKDPQHPFIVRAGEYVTKVLGTHFGIRVYPDETEWSTTLAEGRVEVSYHGDCVMLNPGQQAYLEKTRLKIRDVEVETELSWVKGMFVFRHERLEQVVRELSRWYDVNFLFEGEKLKEYVFTGSVSRDIGIDEILSLIERMNVVRFERSKGDILIKTNDKVKTYN